MAAKSGGGGRSGRGGGGGGGGVYDSRFQAIDRGRSLSSGSLQSGDMFIRPENFRLLSNDNMSTTFNLNPVTQTTRTGVRSSFGGVRTQTIPFRSLSGGRVVRNGEVFRIE